MPISEKLDEVRLSIPDEVYGCSPDHLTDHECWKHSRGDGLTIHKSRASREFILNANLERPKIVGEYHDHRDAKR